MLNSLERRSIYNRVPDFTQSEQSERCFFQILFHSLSRFSAFLWFNRRLNRPYLMGSVELHLWFSNVFLYLSIIFLCRVLWPLQFFKGLKRNAKHLSAFHLLEPRTSCCIIKKRTKKKHIALVFHSNVEKGGKGIRKLIKHSTIESTFCNCYIYILRGGRKYAFSFSFECKKLKRPTSSKNSRNYF